MLHLHFKIYTNCTVCFKKNSWREEKQFWKELEALSKKSESLINSPFALKTKLSPTQSPKALDNAKGKTAELRKDIYSTIKKIQIESKSKQTSGKRRYFTKNMIKEHCTNEFL
jgi:hypothetical protein